MKSHLLLFCSLLTSLFFVACQPDSATSTSSTPKVPCVNPTFGDYLTLDLEYRSPEDSVLFSTFNKNRLEIQFQKSFFKGLLNEGLQKMCPSDSQVFVVNSKELLGEKNPISKKAATINFIVKLYDVKSKEEYKAERMGQQNQQRVKDDSLIVTYMTQKNLQMEKSNSGVYYIIENAGKTPTPSLKNKVKIDYNIQLLADSVKLEFSNKDGKEIGLNRLPKGMREIIMKLGKGGKAQAIIPSPLAYQNRQRGRIPPNSVLKYEVELLDFEEIK
ncbi:MAG: FKBP-type peptidyl-prolyl cis-trans isomerase [Chitinophagales bacterium]